jgi:hypothetical protein
MDPDDLGVDDEFGGEIAREVIDSGVVGAVGRDGDPPAHVPGLDNEYGVCWTDGCFIVKDDGVGDAFGDYFVGGESIPGVIRKGVGVAGTEQRIEEYGEGEQ